MTIKELINTAIKQLNSNEIEESNLKVKMLLCYILKQNKTYLLINENEEIESSKQEEFLNGMEKLIKGVPIQYIINKKEFMGIDFYVDENVLIPQPDTEILVEEVIKISKNMQNSQILDLCTGSGAIGISLAKNIKNSKITLTDISSKAIQIAKLNAEKNNVHTYMKFIQSDMFKNIEEKFDIIVSNPPYIETNEIKNLSKEVQNEPTIALDGGQDGLNFYKEIIQNSYKFLNNNGYLCLEIGYNQKDKVISLLKNINKYGQIYSKQDLEKNDRIVIAKKVGN